MQTNTPPPTHYPEPMFEKATRVLWLLDRHNRVPVDVTLPDPVVCDWGMKR